jgi:hypothetical protein
MPTVLPQAGSTCELHSRKACDQANCPLSPTSCCAFSLFRSLLLSPSLSLSVSVCLLSVPPFFCLSVSLSVSPSLSPRPLPPSSLASYVSPLSLPISPSSLLVYLLSKHLLTGTMTWIDRLPVCACWWCWRVDLTHCKLATVAD